jgi:hypothetical protein
MSLAIGIGYLTAAQAQDPAPTGPAPASAQATNPDSAPSSQANTAAAAQTSASQTGANPANASGKAAKQAPVCFQLTGHCVDAKSSTATKAAAGSGATKATTGAQKPLNLNAPDIRTVVSPDELKEPLPSNDEVTETEEADTVAVKGDKGPPPDVPGGFGALWWAVNHPSQAWRILTPAE